MHYASKNYLLVVLYENFTERRYNYMKISKKIVAIVVTVMIFTIVFINPNKVKADPGTLDITYSNLTKIGEMDMTTLRDLLDVSGTCLQNFARYSTSNIYFFSASRNNDTYIIRCSLSSGVFTPLDYFVLDDYGHGESIEVTDYNVTNFTYTLWVGAELSDGGWSKYIARIKYRINNQSSSGATVDESQTKIITGLIDAATNTTGNTNEYRSTVCISSSSDDRICFTTRKKVNNINGIYNMVYDFSDVNDALNNAQASTIALSSLSAYRKSIFWIPKSEAYPNNSFQGEETTGTGAGDGMLYISGGGTSEDGKINRFSYTDLNGYNLEAEYTVKTTTAYNTDIYNAEIEGLKIYNTWAGENIFMLFRKPNGTNDIHTIYSWLRSDNQ